jgi:NADPH2:quinone reductase
MTTQIQLTAILTSSNSPMATHTDSTTIQLRSLVKPEGEVEIALVSVPIPTPGKHEVLVRLQASPLNPTDIMLMFGAADISTAKLSGSDVRQAVTFRIPQAAMQSMAGRIGQSLPVGREGAGLVVGAGASPAAQALLGKTVAILGSGMYSQYQAVSVEQCLLLPEGATAADGASSFINPLTALGMVETMRLEGHKALVHTAAASNLGQMLNRLCQKDGIGLVNVVRKREQVELLKSMGAAHVCDSGAPDFPQALAQAVAATGATIAFDATGGGKLTGQILSAMESALRKSATAYSPVGSGTHKQVYQYGRLDTGVTEFSNDFGLAWGIGGWMVFAFLQKVGPQAVGKLKQRVMNELKTTFASRYTREISLIEMLQPEIIQAYYKRATGEKFLLNLSQDVMPVQGR